MPDVRAFTGLLFDPRVAGPLDTLTTGPYDNISPADQERAYRANPFNVIRLILGRDEPGNDASTNKYARAGAYLDQWRDGGVLVATGEPSIFPYELRFHLGGSWRTVRGIVAEVGLEPWGGSIIPHERTFPGPIDDRLRLLRAVKANLSPVYTVFARSSPELSAFLDRAMAGPPVREVEDESGTRHRLWIATEGFDGPVEALRRRRLMIADGHHRFTVALAYREEMRARVGPGPWDSMMMFVVDGAAEDPPVLPIHRLVTVGDRRSVLAEAQRAGQGQDEWKRREGERVRDLAEILATLRDEDLTYGTVRLEEGEVVHRVGSLQGQPPTVCALHDQVLDRLAGAELWFVPDAVAAEEAVLSGASSAAYLLPPTTVERVWRLVEAGEKLPQKSTYFWPKPRTGLVIRPMDVDTP
jgi:uncharacterized protein (DUF1015 family)